MGLQLLPLVRLDMHIAGAAKDSEVGDIWLGLVPELIGSGSLDSSSRGAVVDMDKCCNSCPPEAGWQVCLIEHGGDALLECPVCSLCHTILVRLSPDSVLPGNPFSPAEVFPFLGHVLTTLVISECLDSAVQLVLSICLELLECSKCSTLGPQWQDSPEAAVIINEGDPVLVAFPGLGRQGAMHI